MFKLVQIEDAGSGYKSETAKMLVKQLLPDDCVYMDCNEKRTTEHCQNNILTHREDNAICKVIIKDVFVLKSIDGIELRIGNHCIETLVLAGFVSNVDVELIRSIIETLKVKAACFLCMRPTQKHYHKTCLEGRKEDTFVLCEQIKLHNQCMIELKCNFYKKIVQRRMGGSRGLQTIYDKESSDFIKKDLHLLERTIEEYYVLFTKDLEIYLAQNPACFQGAICETISRQARYPSDKQMAVISKITRRHNYVGELVVPSGCFTRS